MTCETTQSGCQRCSRVMHRLSYLASLLKRCNSFAAWAGQKQLICSSALTHLYVTLAAAFASGGQEPDIAREVAASAMTWSAVGAPKIAGAMSTLRSMLDLYTLPCCKFECSTFAHDLLKAQGLAMKEDQSVATMFQVTRAQCHL